MSFYLFITEGTYWSMDFFTILIVLSSVVFNVLYFLVLPKRVSLSRLFHTRKVLLFFNLLAPFIYTIYIVLSFLNGRILYNMNESFEQNQQYITLENEASYEVVMFGIIFMYFCIFIFTTVFLFIVFFLSRHLMNKGSKQFQQQQSNPTYTNKLVRKLLTFRTKKGIIICLIYFTLFLFLKFHLAFRDFGVYRNTFWPLFCSQDRGDSTYFNYCRTPKPTCTDHDKYAWAIGSYTLDYLNMSHVLLYQIQQYSSVRNVVLMTQSCSGTPDHDLVMRKLRLAAPELNVKCVSYPTYCGKNAVKMGSDVRLYSWAMTEYERVVYLDGDFQLMGDLDELFCCPKVKTECCSPPVWGNYVGAAILALMPDEQIAKKIDAYMKQRKHLLNSYCNEGCFLSTMMARDILEAVFLVREYQYMHQRKIFVGLGERDFKTFHHRRRCRPWKEDCFDKYTHGIERAMKDRWDFVDKLVNSEL